MDVYASSTDDILEDEEHYADQLKEYFFFPQKVCAWAQDAWAYAVWLGATAQDLASKKQSCEELATEAVKTFSSKGVTTEFFGWETPEDREARIKMLNEQINEGEQQLKSRNLEDREFLKNAWADTECLEAQKSWDL